MSGGTIKTCCRTTFLIEENPGGKVLPEPELPDPEEPDPEPERPEPDPEESSAPESSEPERPPWSSPAS